MGVAAMKIDGVFLGGGIKGIALIGAFEELENQGFEDSNVSLVQVLEPLLLR